MSKLQANEKIEKENIMNLSPESLLKKHVKSLQEMQAKMEQIVIKDNEKQIAQSEEENIFYKEVQKILRNTVQYMDSVETHPNYEKSKKILEKVFKRDDGLGESEENDEVDAKVLFRQETDIFNNNELRQCLIDSLRQNRSLKIKLQKIIQSLLVKYEEL